MVKIGSAHTKKNPITNQSTASTIKNGLLSGAAVIVAGVLAAIAVDSSSQEMQETVGLKQM